MTESRPVRSKVRGGQVSRSVPGQRARCRCGGALAAGTLALVVLLTGCATRPHTAGLIANDAPRFVGTLPFDRRPRPPEASFAVPAELTQVSPYAYPRRTSGAWRVEHTALLGITNDQVEVVLAPEIGGSILVHRFRRTGDNYFKLIEENLNLRNTVWMDWGGYCDLGFKAFWGAPFYLQPYACATRQHGPEQTIVGTATAGNVQLTRTCTIREGSTALRIETVQKNIGPYPESLQVFAHATIQLGRENNEGDLFFGRRQDGSLFRRPYVIGEETWHPIAVTDGWGAATDPRERKAWVMIFDPSQTAAAGFWPGANLGHFYMDQTYEHVEMPALRFYNGELFSRTIRAAPGESLAFTCTFYVVDGLAEVHFATPDLAGYLTVDAPVYGRRDNARIELGVGSHTTQPNVAGEVRLLDAAGQPLETIAVDFGALEPGVAAVRTIEVPLAKCDDGAHQIELRIPGAGPAAVTRTAVTIDENLVGRVLALRDAVARGIEESRARLGAQQQHQTDVLSPTADLELALWRAGAAAAALRQHRYAEAFDHLEDARRRLARVQP